jgi:predicted transcriptional regulator
MSAMSIRLPDSLHRNARAFAEQEGVSVNQLIAAALGEKLAALGAEEFLASRAQRASKAAFEHALAQVPDVAAAPGDAAAEGGGPEGALKDVVTGGGSRRR